MTTATKKKTTSSKDELKEELREDLILAAAREIIPEPYLEGVLKRVKARRLSLRESLRRVLMAAIVEGEL